MKKTILIKKDEEVILRITLSGKEAAVTKMLQDISDKMFYFMNAGKAVADEINKKEEIK